MKYLFFVLLICSNLFSQQSASAKKDDKNLNDDFRFHFSNLDVGFGYSFWALHGSFKIDQDLDYALYLGFGYSQKYSGADNPPGTEVDSPPFDWWIKEEEWEKRDRAFFSDITYLSSLGIFASGGIVYSYSNIYNVYRSTASNTQWSIFKEDTGIFGLELSVGYQFLNEHRYYFYINYSTIRSISFGIGKGFL
jgi:hypothetical protein